MNDVVVVQEFDTLQYLIDIESALVIGNDASTLMQFHHRALFAQFQYDVHIRWILEEAQKLDDIFMFQRLVDCYFLGHLFALVVFDHKTFRHNFSGENLVRSCVSDFVAFCKATLENDKNEDECDQKAVSDATVVDIDALLRCSVFLVTIFLSKLIRRSS